MIHKKAYETIRQEVLARDNHECQFCGSSENIEIHHLDGKGSEYKVRDMNNDKSNLIALCHKCHLTLEALKRGRGFMVRTRNRKLRKKRAWILYQQGLTTREVGRIVNRSHAWVALIVKEFEKARSGLKVN